MATRPRFLLGMSLFSIWKRSNTIIDQALETLAAQGFNCILITCSWMPGATLFTDFGPTNRDGNNPTPGAGLGFAGPWTDPAQARFEEPFMEVIDYIVDKAASLNMYVGLFAIWGNGFYTMVPSDRPDIAYAFGNWFGARYSNRSNVIFLSIGEYQQIPLFSDEIDEDAPEYIELINQFQLGVRNAAPNHLISIHPGMSDSSSEHYQSATWRDFNSIETFDLSNSETLVTTDYNKTPISPVLLAECVYEETTVGGLPVDGYYIRYEAYHSTFQGSAGHWTGNYYLIRAISDAYITSHLNQEGALDMVHLKRLMESRWLGGAPMDSLVVSGLGTYTSGTDRPGNRLRGILSPTANSAMIYFPQSAMTRNINLNLLTAAGTSINCWWYNTRDGLCYNQSNVVTNQPFNVITKAASVSFTSPGTGTTNDWVLVLDDSSAGYVQPGSAYTL